MKERTGEEKKIQGQDEPETTLTRWHCDTDCRAANRACRGESGKDPKAPDLCPYYEDMLF
jgi:hypothetical protein